MTSDPSRTNFRARPMVDDKQPAAASRHAVVVDRVVRAWRGSRHAALLNIHCTVRDGVLVIHGRVPTFYAKQMAQSLARKVEGVQHIENRVEVATGRPSHSRRT